jgi:hypothetical protein
MYLYIELWKAKDAWLQLTPAQRQAKINELLTLAQQHPITGVIPFSFRDVGDVRLFDGVTEQPVVIDDAVARPTGFHYAEAWMVPTLDLIKQFENRVEALGWWFEYFDQQNAWGVMDRDATVNDMIYGTASPPITMPTQPAGLGRIGRAENDIRTLVQGVGDLQKDISVVVDYVRAKK